MRVACKTPIWRDGYAESRGDSALPVDGQCQLSCLSRVTQIGARECVQKESISTVDGITRRAIHKTILDRTIQHRVHAM